MRFDEYNIKAINDVYKNAHIALQSISDLLPMVKSDELKEELRYQYEGYENLIGKISSFMKENNIEPKDINPFKKAMLWGSIKMKTILDHSENNAAEMMLQGTVMGISELTAMKNEEKNLDEEITLFLKEILELEEEYEERLKKFL